MYNKELASLWFHINNKQGAAYHQINRYLLPTVTIVS